MDWLDILKQIFEVCIIPLLGVLTGILIKWIQIKKEEINVNTNNALLKKYTTMLADTITTCVVSTNQTYVDALKEEGKFDAEAQKIAFSKTFSAIMDILSADAQVYLSEAYGDLTTYITNQIEQRVNIEKLWE